MRWSTSEPRILNPESGTHRLLTKKLNPLFPLEILHFSSFKEIDEKEWNELTEDDFPFLDHAYLLAMEEGGCVGEGTGWEPAYLGVRDQGRMVGASCLYEKTNSYGEYIFDWEWAHAFERYRQNYYPKLTSAVPFTPATGRKLLVHRNADRAEVEKALVQGALDKSRNSGASSLHYLFIREEEIPVFESMGFQIRHTFQFHWLNQDYQEFNDFLARLKSKRRKDIIRERRKVREQQIHIELLEGEAIQPEHIQVMYGFYLSTIDKKWASAYLTLDFFRQIQTTMRENMVLIMARNDQEWVAGSINYRKGNALFGRYWGCFKDYRFLHFELCYYQTIEYAINHRLALFEAGAQGSHKVQRGFLPEKTYSAHWIEHPAFRKAIFDFLDQERNALKIGLQEFESSPYREED